MPQNRTLKIGYDGQYYIIVNNLILKQIGRSGALTLATMWMDLEHMALSERRQTQDTTQCVIPCM